MYLLADGTYELLVMPGPSKPNRATGLHKPSAWLQTASGCAPGQYVDILIVGTFDSRPASPPIAAPVQLTSGIGEQVLAHSWRHPSGTGILKLANHPQPPQGQPWVVAATMHGEHVLIGFAHR